MRLQTNMTVNKITDQVWEIPTSEKEGMLVPARIYATERVLTSMDRGVFEQVTNVACLPGIRRYALCMPDGHWGYGFPIGGVAAFDVQDGVISPGGVGYDVNCLDGETQLLHEFGYRRSIRSLDRTWQGQRLVCINRSNTVGAAEVVAYIAKRDTRPVYRVTTESGRQVLATADHPFRTARGMVELEDLKVGDQVSVYPFEGAEYRAPSSEVLVTEERLGALYPGSANGLAQCVTALKERGLLPLRLDHPALPLLIKLMGFIQGDGCLQLEAGGRKQIGLYGKREDLRTLQADIKRIGFRPSRIYRRHRRHRVTTRYGTVEFSHEEESLHLRSSALALLLVALGTPKGNKAEGDFDTPHWLAAAPGWMKRMYLAALFGAELSTPHTVTDHHFNFGGPVFGMNKQQSRLASGRRFMKRIQSWLREFGVESAVLAERDEYTNKDGTLSVRLRLQISADPENLIRLWSRVGFEYNKRKTYLGNLAVQYLTIKRLVLQERTASIGRALELRRQTGATLKAITAAIGSKYVNERFVARSLWETRKTETRIAAIFPGFDEFIHARTKGLGKTGQVWDTIIAKEPVSRSGMVYDLTVRNEAHNFVANGFNVSNCGMRLIRTDLTLADVQPRLEPLMTELFRRVPAGVGSKGFVRVNRQEYEEVMRRGAKWCIDRGYGWHEDLERIEERGCIPGADPGKVSDQAFERGHSQLGTLGSGNHYLEVQVVSNDRIFDAATATALGITGQDQIVVMVHCGSRGFGHQVASDYLRVFEKTMRRYGISVKDQQLACAPFRSPEGQDYFAAMNCAANSAFANRQVIMHQVRQAFSAVFGQPAEALGMHLIYDVAHNIAKVERYVEGELVVHRKGSTRAFGPGRQELPALYRETGQPVICGGSMETGSYLLVGTEQAERETFGSTMHGSGRTMSRAQAKKSVRGEQLRQDMARRGILVKAVSMSGLAEEAGFAYKNISEVVETVDRAGITKKVAELRPIGNIKG